jgi:hypothetical protein
VTDLSARPLGLAEIVDRSIAVGRRRFRALFLAMLVVGVPVLLLGRALPDPLELLGAVSRARAAAAAIDAALRLLWILLALVTLQLLATALAAALVEPTLDPRRAAPRPSRGRRIWAALTAAAFHVLLLAAAPALGALPGIVLLLRAGETGSLATAVAGLAGALLGGLGLLLVVTFRLMLAPAAAAIEGRAGLAALARSARLMAPRPGARLLERPGVRATLVLLAAFVLAAAVSGLVGLPRLLAHRASGEAPGLGLLGGELPIALDLAVTGVEAVLNAALQPFSILPVVIFYFDRRARTEALDVELWAERLERSGAT